MKLDRAIRSTAGLAAILLFAACSSTPQVEIDSEARTTIYESRLNKLSTQNDWALAGRLAVSDGKDGGSGNFNWIKQSDASRMDFHGALGRGAWRMMADTDAAVLELADGEIYRARSVSELVQQRLGWTIPIDALAWWVRGLAAPGDWQLLELDERGLLVNLHQFGWEIEYGRYTASGAFRMPIKMTARQDSHSVKLAVRNWTLGPAAAPDD